MGIAEDGFGTVGHHTVYSSQSHHLTVVDGKCISFGTEHIVVTGVCGDCIVLFRLYNFVITSTESPAQASVRW